MKTLEHLISVTQSFFSHTEGDNVAMFVSESEHLEKDVESLGFARHYCKEGRVISFFSGMWWNNETNEGVFIQGNKWSMGTPLGVVGIEKNEQGDIRFVIQ